MLFMLAFLTFGDVVCKKNSWSELSPFIYGYRCGYWGDSIEKVRSCETENESKNAKVDYVDFRVGLKKHNLEKLTFRKERRVFRYYFYKGSLVAGVSEFPGSSFDIAKALASKYGDSYDFIQNKALYGVGDDELIWRWSCYLYMSNERGNNVYYFSYKYYKIVEDSKKEKLSSISKDL